MPAGRRGAPRVGPRTRATTESFVAPSPRTDADGARERGVAADHGVRDGTGAGVAVLGLDAGAAKAAGTKDDTARVINIGSIDGIRVPLFENFSYSASKAAVHVLTRHLAHALVKDHVNVNAIAPEQDDPVRLRRPGRRRGRDAEHSDAPRGPAGRHRRHLHLPLVEGRFVPHRRHHPRRQRRVDALNLAERAGFSALLFEARPVLRGVQAGVAAVAALSSGKGRIRTRPRGVGETFKRCATLRANDARETVYCSTSTGSRRWKRSTASGATASGTWLATPRTALASAPCSCAPTGSSHGRAIRSRIPRTSREPRRDGSREAKRHGTPEIGLFAPECPGSHPWRAHLR